MVRLKQEQGKIKNFSLVRAGDTRWGSHHNTMLSLKSLFPGVVKVLQFVKNEGDNALSRRQASGLSNVLSRALQRKDQNILKAVSLVQGTKMSLQSFRENGFDELLEDVNSFCQKYNLERLNMDELYVVSRNRKKDFTNQHYFKVDIFIAVLDMIIRELNDRFSEVSTELLNNMAALSPRNSFCMFNESKLMKLSEMYPMDFNERERDLLKRELNIYHKVVRQDDKFSNLNGIADLAKLMVETEKHLSYRYVYRCMCAKEDEIPDDE
ncbi:uncharacterized protein [Rutidosis leptorrhynchoides]|uniref:uncharacterized protein n=1 Tax=Rutidosis leptorrhynchoides TaxID=125765 RepID=UPI003A99DA62